MEIKYSIKELGKLLDEKFPAKDCILKLLQKDERKSAQSLLKKYQNKIDEYNRVMKMYEYENKYIEKGFKIIAGVDEVGRGPLAGPVVVASVILPENLYLPYLNDSKKVSISRRNDLYNQIQELATDINISIIDSKTIDRINIYQATINAMYDSIYGLKTKPNFVLIDAMPLNNLEIPHESLIKGDSRSASIAAASIIAKVERDRLMQKYDELYPEYDFANNNGYGTAKHLEAIDKYGICPIHRHSFEPIKSLVGDKN